MLDINTTKMRYEVTPDNKNHAICTCEPLDRGYGTTIGSSLKRILLSSLKGAAVVAVRFQGAESLNDQLDTVKDSLQEIVLRLRELSIRPIEKSVKATLSVTAGSEDVVATVADIKAEDGAELDILDQDKLVATVKAGQTFEMEIFVAGGYGYIAAEKNYFAPKDMIPMDIVFSPLRRVEYKVQNTRVGNTTDYDRLVLELETDGTLTPADALNRAASLMIDSLSPLWQLSDAEIEEQDPDINNVIYDNGDTTTVPITSKLDVLDRPIEELELNVRPFNCMRRAGIVTIGDLVQHTDEEVKNFRNLGSKSFDEIVDRLAERGLALRPAES